MKSGTACGLLLAAAGWITAGAACAPELGDNPAYSGCNSDADCDAGVCRSGFCVLDIGPGACDANGQLVADGKTIDGCYTGPDDTVDVGACKSGQRQCIRGTLTDCLGEVLPDAETCNGKDDDCDGQVDELADSRCLTDMKGQCERGTLVCAGTLERCDPDVQPQPETCNGVDDDCDDETDEGVFRCYPDGVSGCTLSSDGTFSCTGSCKTGTFTCMDGHDGPCTGMVEPSAEVCTSAGQIAADENCDGTVDEGCNCVSGTRQNCYTGPDGTAGVGACHMGTQSCTNGEYGSCSGQRVPAPESCANMAPTTDPQSPDYDDDCNGVVDDVTGLDDPCVDDTKLGECMQGTKQCMEGALTCVTRPITTEVCDGKDNDCDGVVDDGFDLLADEGNCGACGNVCGQGLTCCDGQCVNTQSSEDACGACGNACGTGLACCSGTCMNLSASEAACGACGNACGEGLTCCGGNCLDVRNDPGNCGTCGKACATDQTCCGGACALPDGPACTGCPATCPAGTTCCNGSCADTDTDEGNCGMCGNGCNAGQLCCGGSCVPGNDVANCGVCGNACLAGQLCCDGACTASDGANCGNCGNSCGANEGCCDGSCKSLENPVRCGSCTNRCAPQEKCTNQHCCMRGRAWCSGAGCVDLDTDPGNCGTCGNACLVDEQCRTGCCCKADGGCRC